MSRRFATVALVLGVIVASAGCSTPKTASGTFTTGRAQVVQLVLDAARALPATSRYDPPTEVGAQPCRKTIAGYVIGSTGAHRAQVPLIVYPPKDSSLRGMFGRLVASWRKAGDTLDRSREHESRLPQLRAHAAHGNDIVATAFASPFVVKIGGERYSDYAHRAGVAGVRPLDAAAWRAVTVGTKRADVLVTSQIDLYAVSQCLHGS